MIRTLIAIMIFMFMAATALQAQTGTIKGTVKSATTGDPLIGATVVVVDLNQGTKTNREGEFTIQDVPVGNYNVRASYIGHESQQVNADVNPGKAKIIDFELVEKGVMSRAINVVASRAEFRETPVAFSNVAKPEMNLKLGSRDLPMVLNETPGVYATEQGGGAGDARINIRGFDQRNVAVMINGVPVNDMENGWVYWSNWDGLGDVTSSVQVQRGLGAGKIANPYVGGTVNIITDPAQQRPGVSYKQEIGNGSFLKSTLVANTGDMDGFAASFAGVRKSGDGVIDKGWTDAWAYYLGLSYSPSEDHQFEFYVIGAPQQHGQRSYKQSIATFDHEKALDEGVPQEDVNDTPERGIEYNPNWGPTGGLNTGKDYYNGSEHDVRDKAYLMERENYYHKPQMNLNWYWQIQENLSLTNVFYFSNGIGGGSGPYGDYLDYNDQGQIDFEGAIRENTSDETIDPERSNLGHESTRILRNSVNQHFWIGYLGTVDIEPTDNLTVQAGLDVRYYEGQHWREVRNLLGGDYFTNTSDKTIDYSQPNADVRYLGDKIDYHNDGLVTWYGGFFQSEYQKGDITGYLNLSLSNTGMKRVDHFRTPDMPNGHETDWYNMLGYTVKGGANYNFTDQINAYFNAGYYSRAPNFRNVYYYDNSRLENIVNEKVLAFELGTGYYSRMFKGNLNLYYTAWNDRSWYTSSYVEDPEGNRTYYNYNLAGIDATHMGAELDFRVQPHRMFMFKGMVSLGNWEWANNVEARFSPDDDPNTEFTTFVYAEGLKVGDAAQKSMAASVYLYPLEDFTLNVTYIYFMDHYSDFDPARRTSPDDTEQSWQLPNYGLLSAHLYYTLPLGLPVDITLFGHGYNLTDSKYITDASDGSGHDAASADVYFGLPMRWNFGLKIAY